MCYWSRLPSDSSVASEKQLMSSGKRKPCTKLWATRPPWPWDQVLTLAVADKGLSLNLKEGYHPTLGLEEDTMFLPTWVGGWEAPASSWITIPPNDWGGVFVGGGRGGSTMRYFFFARPEVGSGVRSLMRSCWDWEAEHVPSKNWSTVKARLVTISSPKSVVASKEWVESATPGSVA